MNNRLIKSNDAGGGGACTNTVDLYNPFPDGGGVALYQLNGDATDESGNYDGTATSVTYGTGEFGQAGVFNGSSSYISITSGATIGDQRGFSCWVKDFNGYMFTNNEQDAPNNSASSFSVEYYTTNSLLIITTDKYNGSTYGGVIFDCVVPSNQWGNIAFSVNGANIVAYLNNVELVASANQSIWTPRTDTSTSLANSYIGRRPGTTLIYSSGSLDQVRIFNRALRPYEVEALYTEEYCTPTIVPSEHFNTVLYTGNGTSQTITGVGFDPDMVWVKRRDASANSHILQDTIRGGGQANTLIPDRTDAQGVNGQYGYISSFGTDSFGVAAGTTSAEHTNFLNASYVAWNFKAGGADVQNTDGTITSQVSANTEAGFSVVSYTANGTDGASVGHGLDSAPKMIIYKGRNATGNWIVLTTAIDGSADYLFLNTTAEKGDYPSNYIPTDNLFYSISSSSTLQFIAYCFAEVEGFSNFGSYVGTNAPNNNIVTGFEPAMIMIKSTGATNGDWNIFDNKRNPSNPLTDVLKANTSGAEATEAALNISFLENGFSLNGTASSGGTGQINQSGISYIYMAFAADPTTVEPSLEDSFNTVTYTGNGGTQTIGGVFEGGGSFNGSSSIITNSNQVIPNGASSISFWYNNNGLNGTNYIIGNGVATNSKGITSTFVSNRFGVFIGKGTTNSAIEFSSTNTFSNSSWHNITITWDGTTSTSAVKLYVNGQLEGQGTSNTSSAGIGSYSSFGIGGVNGGGYAAGSIDQVRIFNTALTAAQVTELYEETDADSSVCNFPSGAGGIALYELNGNANDTCGTYNGTATNVTWLNNGTGFQPDLVWIKERGPQGFSHALYDSVRGATLRLVSNLTNADVPSATGLTSFDNNGFTTGSNTSGNASGSTYVAWAWKGAEIPAINSNGSIPSVVSANPAAGFSIVSYTGNGVNNSTFGHGISGINMVIIKNRDAAENWATWHSSLPSVNSYMYLDSTNATNISTDVFRGTSSSTITVGTHALINANNNNYIAYCFAEVAGFSKFGSYTGTSGSVTVTGLGFEPAFVMIKGYSAGVSYGGSWHVVDNKRGDGGLGTAKFLRLESANAEFTNSVYGLTFTSDGFTIPSGSSVNLNTDGGGFIYMAFANQF